MNTVMNEIGLAVAQYGKRMENVSRLKLHYSNYILIKDNKVIYMIYMI